MTTRRKVDTNSGEGEPKGEKRTTKWVKAIKGAMGDPMVRVRALTAIRGAIAVFVTTLLVYSDGAFANFPLIAIVLCGHFTITLMAHSIVGVVGIAIQSVTGGLVGCFFGYLAYLAAPNLTVKLVYLFLFCIVLGLWDPYLKQGILVKWAIVDFFVILFVGEKSFAPHSVLYGSVMLYVVAHWFSFVVSISLTLLFCPSLSSLEFADEFKLALRMCNEAFKLISFRIDNQILKQAANRDFTTSKEELETILHVHGLPDKDIKELELVLSLRLIRLRRLMNESKAETWNTKLNATNSQLLEHINSLFHYMTNMHEAINSGKFSLVVNHAFLEPMLPFMETMQTSIIKHFEALLSTYHPSISSPSRALHTSSSTTPLSPSPLSPSPLPPSPSTLSSSQSTPPPSPAESVASESTAPSPLALDTSSATLSPAPTLSPTPSSLNKSTKIAKHEVVSRLLAAVDLDESVRLLDTEYSHRVRDYESVEHGVANPSREVTRLVYIIFGAVEFAHTLHDLEILLAEGEDRRSKYRAVWTDVILHFNLFPNPSPVKYCKDIYDHLKTMYTDFRKLTWSSAWHSPMWRFPIRLSLGLVALTLILYAIPSSDTVHFPYFTPYWAALTYVVVVLPTLGATVRKCIHRTLGTITGAFLGHVFLLAVLGVPLAARPFIHLILQLTYFFVIIYLQQIPTFGYSASVAGLTYLTVFVGQYRVGHGDVVYACMRCVFILIGVLWAFLIGNFFFPSKSSIAYTQTLVDTITKIASLFSLTIDKSIEQTPTGTTDQQEIINKAIKGVHTNYLAMRNNLKEAKSELILHWSGYTSYKTALNQALKAYYTLANMNTIVGHKGFSPEIIELVDLMKEHLKLMVAPIVESAQRIDDVFKKKKHVSGMTEHHVAAATVLRKIEAEYFLFRKRHIEQKTLANLHPAIRQFTTFLYLIREFVMEWRILVETVNSFMGLTIEVYPVETSILSSSTFSDATSTNNELTESPSLPSISLPESQLLSSSPASIS